MVTIAPTLKGFFEALDIDWPEANVMGWSETTVVNSVWQILKDTNIKSGYSTMRGRSLQILYLRFVEGWTYRKIGNQYNISSGRIQQILAKELRKARYPTRYRRILNFLRGPSEEDFWPVPFPGNVELALSDFSTRAFYCLKNAGIEAPKDLENWTESDLLKLKNLGKTTLQEIITVLRSRGLSLKEERNPDDVVKFSCVCDVLGWDHSTSEGIYIEVLEDPKTMDFSTPDRTLRVQRAGRMKVSPEELKIFRAGLGGKIRMIVERI